MNLNEKIQEKEELFARIVEEIKKREETVSNLQNEIKQLEVQAYQVQGAVAAFNELREEEDEAKTPAIAEC